MPGLPSRVPAAGSCAPRPDPLRPLQPPPRVTSPEAKGVELSHPQIIQMSLEFRLGICAAHPHVACLCPCPRL